MHLDASTAGSEMESVTNIATQKHVNMTRKTVDVHQDARLTNTVIATLNA